MFAQYIADKTTQPTLLQSTLVALATVVFVGLIAGAVFYLTKEDDKKYQARHPQRNAEDFPPIEDPKKGWGG